MTRTPLAVGRSAEVYRWPRGDGLVVKLFQISYPAESVHREQAASDLAADLGATPIRCRGRVSLAGRDGLLFDEVRGESLTRQAERNPLRILHGARDLARLHVELHSLRPGPAPGSAGPLPDVLETATSALGTGPLGFLTPRQRSAATARIAALPSGDRLLHLDFHPENVFTHDAGHAVIDWQTALRGHPAADVAATLLLVRDAALWPGTPLHRRLAVAAVRRRVAATYLDDYLRRTGMDRSQVEDWRLVALVLRLSTLDVPEERAGFRREISTLLSAER